MSLADHFDTDALQLLQEIMDDEFSELIRVYLDDSRQRLHLMHQAAAQADAAQLRELAHSFKGASSNVSALPLAALLQRLEDAGREQCLQDATELLQQVEQEFASVTALLSARIV